ncbi:hypothetical protein BU17DRAFT_99231 [Hysterangium stoloniferum]|nr:hypothetical protein BU17DRAFT_99231 [Hysterangium stoloniferum]
MLAQSRRISTALCLHRRKYPNYRNVLFRRSTSQSSKHKDPLSLSNPLSSASLRRENHYATPQTELQRLNNSNAPLGSSWQQQPYNIESTQPTHTLTNRPSPDASQIVPEALLQDGRLAGDGFDRPPQVTKERVRNEAVRLLFPNREAEITHSGRGVRNFSRLTPPRGVSSHVPRNSFVASLGKVHEGTQGVKESPISSNSTLFNQGSARSIFSANPWSNTPGSSDQHIQRRRATKTHGFFKMMSEKMGVSQALQSSKPKSGEHTMNSRRHIPPHMAPLDADPELEEPEQPPLSNVHKLAPWAIAPVGKPSEGFSGEGEERDQNERTIGKLEGILTGEENVDEQLEKQIFKSKKQTEKQKKQSKNAKKKTRCLTEAITQKFPPEPAVVLSDKASSPEARQKALLAQKKAAAAKARQEKKLAKAKTKLEDKTKPKEGEVTDKAPEASLRETEASSESQPATVPPTASTACAVDPEHSKCSTTPVKQNGMTPSQRKKAEKAAKKAEKAEKKRVRAAELAAQAEMTENAADGVLETNQFVPAQQDAVAVATPPKPGTAAFKKMTKGQKKAALKVLWTINVQAKKEKRQKDEARRVRRKEEREKKRAEMAEKKTEKNGEDEGKTGAKQEGETSQSGN